MEERSQTRPEASEAAFLDALSDNSTPAPLPTTSTGRGPATQIEDIFGIQDVDSYLATLENLTARIIKAVNEGKSVTATNKRLITKTAEDIRGATRILPTLIRASTKTSAAGGNPITPELMTPTARDDFKKEIAACVREEVRKITKTLTKSQPSSPGARPSYSEIAGGMAKHARPAWTNADSNAPIPTPPRPITRPAIIVASTVPIKSRQEVLESLRRGADFKRTKYAPLKIQPVSNNKLRVEFQNVQERDDALERLQGSKEVSAEPAHTLRPMVIFKGIPGDIPEDHLVDIVKGQNEELQGLIREADDLKLRFKRKNRNSALYNAVFVAHPRVWRQIMDMGKVRIDHQRTHAEDFSPFRQCFKCLQFGHTRANCSADSSPCAYCADPTHQVEGCPIREKRGAPKCVNCSTHNNKFKATQNTQHRATSVNCPRLRAMKDRISNRIDYGSE
ncbi:uncharacterized protein LOC126380856 [Pectinophora gossypiella]|uniref:uncharacterized protein LOC126380856 n=1 Tax=Pectinophora gossypiella TaxID=13191 RepID=UPI00214EC22E|nr:uncharacterized protein LOC126380856 [Pectinophora gossypiella]